MNHSLPWEDFSLSLVYPDCKLQHTFSRSPYCSCDGLLQATLYLFNNKKSLKHIIDKNMYTLLMICALDYDALRHGDLFSTSGFIFSMFY